MVRCLSKVQANLDRLSEWAIKRVTWAENIQADTLVGIATILPIKETILLSLYFQATSSIATALVCSTNKTSDNWMNEIKAYIQTRELPEDSKQAHKIRV